MMFVHWKANKRSIYLSIYGPFPLGSHDLRGVPQLLPRLVVHAEPRHVGQAGQAGTGWQVGDLWRPVLGAWGIFEFFHE